ncbi:MAG: hypothetical protein ACJ72L_13335 [Marmoricola sp.]
MKSWKLWVAGSAGAAMMLSAPVAAFAVNVSSDDGAGNQYVSSWLDHGANMYGNLKSIHGNKVYYAGTVVYDNWPDDNKGRYTSDTTSMSYVSRGGQLGGDSSFGDPIIDGVHVKICRNRPYVPDGCGSDSNTIRRY